ncbi:hypothetical protein [Paenibacillus silvisoli]|uniref:hypothetical protein n=1 Tax=Paenibacillus silvisoli TaxID=3110539 RepID=UPI002805E4AB|nr:hypothetical protein [Paenibacillus silvisoli]
MQEKGAYGRILHHIFVTPADMVEVMVAIQEGKSPEDAAKEWVDSHEELVKTWITATKS